MQWITDTQSVVSLGLPTEIHHKQCKTRKLERLFCIVRLGETQRLKPSRVLSPIRFGLIFS